MKRFRIADTGSTSIRIRRVLPSLLVLIVLLGFAVPVLAQSISGRYYSETGHTLDPEFVAYFDGHGGLQILGYPITDAFIDYWSGLIVQYTQNARMEFFPDPETQAMQVRLKELGVLFVGERALDVSEPLAVGPNADCEYHPLTGHNVCFMFLEFYREHGGPQLFGYPVSDFTIENDRLVQYFQGFRLDWYPENPPEHQVQVAPLGRVHFEVMDYDRDLLRPKTPSNAMLYEVINLHPKASVEKPIAAVSDTQVVYVVVRDQNYLPVASAAVTLVAHFPQETRTLLMAPTDENGASRLELSYEGQPVGAQIDLEFYVSSGTVLTTTRDSFRIWW
ncbi:MAG: hypothetical protein E4G99_04370 [Anaerolineales bacterium]|nr:MAG: hypothetical protein E4G99_04370 [Anaerolineales bacterium]